MLPRRSDFTRRGSHVTALASELAWPALRALARLSCGAATPQAAWRRGLIVAHSHIGDVLYRTASLDELHSSLPHVQWDLLTSAAASPLLENNPALHGALPLVTGPDGDQLAAGAVHTLKSVRYDVVLCSNMLRVTRDFTLAVALRAPNRIGVAHKGASGLLSRTMRVGPPAPYPVHFRRMVEQLTGRTFQSQVRPRIHLTDADRDDAAQLLRRIPVPTDSQLVACTLSTRQRDASWPSTFFIKALAALHARTGIVVLLGGAPDEAVALERVAASLPFPAHVVAGKLSLRGFAALLEQCAVLLSPDSGPRHVANAVGTPVVFVRNLAAPAIETGAYCDTEMDVAPPGSCLDAAARRQVMERTSPDLAAAALLRALNSHRNG